MVRGAVLGAEFLAGVLGFGVSLAVQLATLWWSGVAAYAQWLLPAQAGLLLVVGLALVLTLRSVQRVQAGYERRARRHPVARRSAGAQLKEGVRQLRPWWPLIGLGFLFGYLLLNLGRAARWRPAARSGSSTCCASSRPVG